MWAWQKKPAAAAQVCAAALLTRAPSKTRPEEAGDVRDLRRARFSFGVPWAFISPRTVPDWSRNAFSIAAKSHTSTL
ncbi:MAG: hypothetical protein EGQ84_08685 [Slackia sp.]|nr:hypothetical protein [Slackia sp.]